MDYSKSYETLSFIDEMVSKHKFEKSYLVELFKSADKKEKKWNTSTKLLKIEDNLLPDYIVKNKKKFSEWLDNSQ